MTALLIKLFVRNHTLVNEPDVRESYGKLGGIVGIACNILLCVIKITIGVITASMSIVADGLNNLSDMGSSVITVLGFRLAGKPADKDHPFGHGRIEYMSALLVSVLIMYVGTELLTGSFKKIFSGESAPEYSVWAIIILVVSVAIKLWMFFFNRCIGKKINSEVLFATAQDSINDCVATAAILLSVILSSIWNFPFNLDAVMACLVGLFIIWSGIQSARETVNQLLGLPPEKEFIDELEEIIMSFDGFIGIHDLIVHNYGPGREFASVHVEVPQDIDIAACHERIDLCERVVNERTGVVLVIHMDPVDINNERVSESREKMAQLVANIDERLTIHDFRMTPSGNTITNLIFDVVVPSDLKLKNEELIEKISVSAKEIDPTFCCVITIDNDFTGR